jgi:ribosomal protein L11 methyltransferase
LSWLEVSLRLEPELADPAAELLGRFALGGVAVEETGDPERPVLVRGWLPIDGQLEQRKRGLQEGVWHLAQIVEFPTPSYRTIEEQDWEDLWKAEYRPLSIGQRLMVVPTWSPVQPGDRSIVRLEPGMAFGTGAHPTTRHCLEILEATVQPDQSVLDLGCGSAILAIAAGRLGARLVLALDTDPVAVELARSNVQANDLADRVTVELGSFAAGRDSLIGPVDMLLANLHSDPLIGMLQGGLAGWVRPTGHLVLSGLLEPDLPQLAQAADRAGLRQIELLATDDWRTVRFQVA